MVFKYSFGMIMSVSTFWMSRGAATPFRLPNLGMPAPPEATSRSRITGPADATAPRQSAAITSECAIPSTPCMQTQPDAIRPNRRNQTPSDAIRRHQTPSDAIRRHHRPSQAITGNQRHAWRTGVGMCESAILRTSVSMPVTAAAAAITGEHR